MSFPQTAASWPPALWVRPSSSSHPQLTTNSQATPAEISRAWPRAERPPSWLLTLRPNIVVAWRHWVLGWSIRQHCDNSSQIPHSFQTPLGETQIWDRNIKLQTALHAWFWSGETSLQLTAIEGAGVLVSRERHWRQEQVLSSEGNLWTANSTVWGLPCSHRGSDEKAYSIFVPRSSKSTWEASREQSREVDWYGQQGLPFCERCGMEGEGNRAQKCENSG